MTQTNNPPRVSFIIAGVQKAATTALSRFLATHPNAFLPKHEAHYFDHDKLDWANPDHASYEKRFVAAKPGQLVGEKSPSYLFWDHALGRIRNYNPAMKLIVSLRNPVDRAYSHWRMETYRGNETRSFSYAIRDGRKRIAVHDGGRNKNKRRFSFVERGFYAAQIEQALALFPREQLLFLTNCDLAKNQRTCLDRLCHFLNIDTFRKYPPDEKILPRYLNVTPAQVRPLEEMAPLLGDDVKYLRGLYGDDISRTEALTGLALGHWLSS